MSDGLPQSACHEFDGDIAGLGVRLSFYLQNFILVLLVDRSYEDAENALWTFIATSFGLTVAALVQLKNDRLSLLEGILVSQLAWFANIGTFLALASYSRSKGKDNAVKVAAVLQGYLSMILTILMWAYAHRFESPTLDCEFKFFFLFGWGLPALGSGRKVALAFASLTILVYTWVTFIECRTWMKHRRSRAQEHDLEMDFKWADRKRRGSSGSAQTSRHNRTMSTTSDFKKKQPPRERTNWLGMEVDPIFIGIIVSQIIVLAYFISTTELIIRRSGASPKNEFGFGQVLALTPVMPSLIALCRAIQKNRMAKRQDDKRLEDESLRTREGLLPGNGGNSLRGPSRSLLSPPSPCLGLSSMPVDDPAGGLAPAPASATVGGGSCLSISTASQLRNE